MSVYGRGVIIAAVTIAGAAMAQDHATPPVAVYWMSAQTTSGIMAMMNAGGGGRPSASALMNMALHGGPDPDAANHSLKLQLGSTRRAPGEPDAEHDPAQVLGVGPVLPLVSPAPVVAQRGQPEERQEEQPRQMPKGKILIYWGCGDHAGPNQPEVIDFAKMSQNPEAMASMMRGFVVTPMQPPSSGRYTTYGEWPNARSSTSIPANGSLVGEHVVKGNYTPQIRFALNQNQDFMAPFQLTSNQRIQSGAVQLAWTPIPNTVGYFASAFGSQGGRNQSDGSTTVMWSSSATRVMAFMSPDFLPPAEARRLVADGHLMAPTQTACKVPQEVIQAMGQGGMLQMAAYGEEANFAYPPRPNPDKPWHPEWVVKVRYKSSTSAGLGQASPGGNRDQQEQKPKHGPGSILKGLGGLGGLIP